MDNSSQKKFLIASYSKQNIQTVTNWKLYPRKSLHIRQIVRKKKYIYIHADSKSWEALLAVKIEGPGSNHFCASKNPPFSVLCTYLAIFTTWSAFLVRGLIPWSSCSSGVTIRERWLSRNRSIKRFSFCRVKFRSARQYCTAFSKCFFPVQYTNNKEP